MPQPISGPNQIGLLRPRTYGPKWKRTAFDIKKFGPNQNALLPFRSQADQIKTFCFRSDNKLRYRSDFAFVSISLTLLQRTNRIKDLVKENTVRNLVSRESREKKTKCDRIAPSHPLSWPCVSDLLYLKARAATRRRNPR